MLKVADRWDDYEIIDIGGGEKLERWKDIILIRPDPQVIFTTDKDMALWNDIHARYIRSSGGGGKWEYLKDVPDRWVISYGDLRFYVSPTNFKHTGLFPEQAVNWEYFSVKIKESKRQLNILNLFAYTGGATLACAAAGAIVCHVDAAKGMVQWAKENISLSGLSDKPVRYMIDDVYKFVLREQRRGSRYDAVIMDPPSYGRGPGGEVWKAEDDLYDLVEESSKLLSESAVFFHINSYTTGFSPVVLENMLKLSVRKKMQKGETSAGELAIPVKRNGLLLPCGLYARWET
jgi:23S rRNA (cytosine1962-C5)-methyltransferase